MPQIQASGLRSLIALFLILTLLCLTPARAEHHVLMNQAMDLIHKAWNPGGKAPSNATRTKLLKQAMELMRDDPYSGYQGHRRQAMRYVRSALIEIEQGDPYHMVNDYLQDAEDECRAALSDTTVPSRGGPSVASST